MTKKKTYKKIINSILLVIGFFILVSSIILGFLKYNLNTKKEQTFYKSFEIAIPDNYSIHGIDVSKYQSYIYWNSVNKMQVDGIHFQFAFIKATEGLKDIDGMFKRNWKLLKQHKLTHGAYHYFIATSNGKLQAYNFIENVKLEKGNLPPVVDVEQSFGLNKTSFKKELMNCLVTLEQHYKVKPIIYSYVEFYNEYLGDEFKKYPLWVAHYTENNKPKITRDWIFWQYSDKGKVEGITEKVDFNVFNGDSIAFNKILMP